MPHLSPIIWTFLYMAIWSTMLIMIISTEYFNSNLNRN